MLAESGNLDTDIASNLFEYVTHFFQTRVWGEKYHDPKIGSN